MLLRTIVNKVLRRGPEDVTSGLWPRVLTMVPEMPLQDVTWITKFS